VLFESIIWVGAGVAEVPLELQRQFGLMRELDERSYRLQQQVDADMLQHLKAAADRQQGKTISSVQHAGRR
jgi:hypothetical protein